MAEAKNERTTPVALRSHSHEDLMSYVARVIAEQLAPLRRSQFEAKGGLNAIHIHAHNDKHGGRRPTARMNPDGELEFAGRREWAEAAIGSLLQQGKIPSDITGDELLRLVREQLNGDTKFKHPKYRGVRGKNKRLPGQIGREAIFEAARLQDVKWRSER